MKRYRVLTHEFDYRPNWLTMEVQNKWEDHIKKMWRDGIRNVERGLLLEYGFEDADRKLQDFVELGPKPESILAYHNRFADQVRRSFVVGGYYPALVAACALGERILNHLVLDLRHHFKGTSEYKKVYRKRSFDDWELAIKTLEAWDVLTPEAVQAFYRLADIRNRRAIHFDPATDQDDRPLALEAIRQLDEIIARQFGVSGSERWFITEIKGGESYIKKEHEGNPFIREVYVAKSFLVGPNHELEYVDGGWSVHDGYNYDEREVSDDEFRKLRLEALEAQATSPE